MNKEKVLVLTKYDRQGASSRLRTFQYIPFLEKHGYEFIVKPLFNREYLDGFYGNGQRSRLSVLASYFYRFFMLFQFTRFRFVWIEKELFPYMPAWIEMVLALMGVRYIVDYDDAIFHNYDLARNKWIRRLLGRKIDAVMRHAACVIAGNEYLADRARAAGAKRVVVIPTVVDHQRYSVDAQTSEGFTIGWIGSPTTQKYVEQLLPALCAVAQQHDFRLLLIGATADITSRLPGIDVDVQPWSEDTEAALIQEMDIGIMPLEDGPWERGKCGYKLIQYMASGVPVVASPVGVNVEIVTSSECGNLASQHEDWILALQGLIESPQQRKRLGANGRQAVESRYSLQVQEPRIEKVLTAAASLGFSR